MPTNSYDLIVVGDDFAGLVAAALCARRGLRVLVLSHGGRPGSYNLGPHRLPAAPMALTGLSTPAVQRVLDELHLTHTLRRKLDGPQQGFQFVGPDVRLDVSADEQALAAAIARELPSGAAEDVCTSSAAVAEHFDAALGGDGEFPPTGFWKRREGGKSAAKLTEAAAEWSEGFESDAMARALVSLPALLDTHIDPTQLSAAARARSFHLWRHGVARLRGNHEALRELLDEVFAKSSGERREARVQGLTYRWGKVSGVTLEGGEELGAEQVIMALPVDEIVPLVDRKLPKRLSQCADAITVCGYRYTWNLIVDQSGIPEGMSSPVVLVDDPAAALTGDNAVGIFVGEPDPEGRVIVTVSATCPAPAEGESLAAALAALRGRLRERVDAVMPFLDEHILVSHSPHEERAPEGAEVARLSPPPVIAPAPVWSSELEAAFDVSAMPYNVGLKNLTVASGQVLPQLGLEGSFVTGWSAAATVSESSGKKREYREVIAGG
ncbi:NAD(P)-binding protein [Haliangium sp.]|uniref:NAD(P)-binding protein n=1 Tax=Haliangium sp. TaxID=2663208 RepID=UPI003D0A6EBF